MDIGKPKRIITVEPAPAVEPVPAEPHEDPVPATPSDRRALSER